VRYFDVLDKQGVVMATVFNELDTDGRRVVDSMRGSAMGAKAPYVVKTRLKDGGGLINAVFPVEVGGYRVGAVRVGISDSVLVAAMRRSILDAALMLIAASLIGAIIAGRVSGWVSGPIQELVKGAAEYSKGNLGYTPDVTGPREFIALASGFSEMAGALKDKMDGLARAKVEAEELSSKLSSSYEDIKSQSERIQLANDWITDLAFRIEETNQQLKAEKVQTDTIVHSIRDGLVALDKDDRVILLNPEAEEIFEVREEDVKGGPVQALVERFVGRVEEPEMFLSRFLAATAAPEMDSSFSITIVKPFRRVLRRLSSPIRDENGEAIGRVVTFRDITKEKEVDDMKTNFVSTVSHELRTPLTSIKGALTLLLDEQVDELETRREFLKIAEQNTDRLISLISSLLDLSRIESGRVNMRFSRLDLGELVKGVVGASSMAARQSGVTVEARAIGKEPVVLGDREKLEQTLTNLIGNAIKFSDPGGKVLVTTETLEGEVRLTVEDEGIGIPNDKLDRIFERFYQVDMSATRRIGGTGLGLTISKAIVKEHGGRVWAESPVTPDGRGARFIVSLPMVELAMRDDEEPLPAMSLPEPVETPHEDRSRTVLIVDDDPGIVRIHKASFEREGYQVLTAMTGHEALRVARAEKPGFIFLDVLLPDLDGFDVASILKGDVATRDIPIVFTTVLGEEARERGISLGAGYITKPFQEQQLISTVKRLLR